jgi:MerR family regulatory protein
MGLVSIGEFSRLSRLSPKALRLYDELGLLVPDHVDSATGYRWYADSQLDQAHVVALLRRINVPLAQIRDKRPPITPGSSPDTARSSPGPTSSPPGSP